MTAEFAGRAVDRAALDATIERFHAEHRRLFGFSLEQPVEIVTLRVTAFGHLDSVGMARLTGDLGAPAEALTGKREVYFEDAGGFVPCDIFDRARLAPGSAVDGPAILENVDSTVVIDPGWRGRIDDYGNCIMRRA